MKVQAPDLFAHTKLLMEARNILTMLEGLSSDSEDMDINSFKEAVLEAEEFLIIATIPGTIPTNMNEVLSEAFTEIMVLPGAASDILNPESRALEIIKNKLQEYFSQKIQKIIIENPEHQDILKESFLELFKD